MQVWAEVNMELVLVSVMVLVAIAAVYWYRLKPVVHHPARTRLKPNPFHAVAVSCPRDGGMATGNKARVVTVDVVLAATVRPVRWAWL